MSNIGRSEYSASVNSFIPLLYVAWADGLLSPSEVRIIKDQIKSADHLTKSEQKLLLDWADPREWPSDTTFKQWMQLMKEASADQDYNTIDSMVDLGMVMGERAMRGHASSAVGRANRAVLTMLNKELNIPGLAKFRALGATSPKGKRTHRFEPLEIQKVLDGTGGEVKDRLKVLLSDPQFSITPIRTKEAYRAQVLDWVKILAAHGFGALGYPEAYGGEDNIRNYAGVFEVLASFDLSLAVKFGVQFGLFGGSIQNLGTKPQHDKYLLETGQGAILGCFAMTETGHGSNVRDLKTEATYNRYSDTITVHSPNLDAGKEFIGNALHCSMASVFAQLIVDGKNHGVHAVLVPVRDASGHLLPGIRVEDNGYKMGLNGIDNGRLWFDQVKVPRENLLNRFGQITDDGVYQSPIENPSRRFFTMLGTLVGGRICVGKGALSAAKVALTIATKYALRRRQFGPDGSAERLIMDYPTHQRRLIPRLAKAYAADFALNHLVTAYDNKTEETARELETMAAGIKSYVTWFSTDAIQASREACGGKGYLWENRFADLKADADIFTTFEGDNTVLMQLVAKGLLSSFKEDFNAAGFMGSIRYLANQVSDSFLAINPLYKRKTDADHLNDPRFHSHAFLFRERKILYALGSRMREMFKKRITPYDVFLRVQNHMMSLAQAYVERVILEQFQQALEQMDNPEVKELMTQVYTLFALETIESNKGWYLEHDYVEGIKTKAIRRSIDRLCANLKDDAGLLVDGFGFSNSILSAPIALEK